MEFFENMEKISDPVREALQAVRRSLAGLDAELGEIDRQGIAIRKRRDVLERQQRGLEKLLAGAEVDAPSAKLSEVLAEPVAVRIGVLAAVLFDGPLTTSQIAELLNGSASHWKSKLDATRVGSAVNQSVVLGWIRKAGRGQPVTILDDVGAKKEIKRYITKLKERRKGQPDGAGD